MRSTGWSGFEAKRGERYPPDAPCGSVTFGLTQGRHTCGRAANDSRYGGADTVKERAGGMTKAVRVGQVE